MAAHRAKQSSGDALAELRRIPRWVRWETVRRRGGLTKMPLTPAGAAASSTDPETWSRYRDASRSAVGDGVGFVLNGDGLVCLDVDHCVTAGRVAPWAADLLEAVGDTYVELSPSGRGLHIWGRANLRAGRVVRIPGGKVECYGSGRYITVTARPVPGSFPRIADIGDVVAALVSSR